MHRSLAALAIVLTAFTHASGGPPAEAVPSIEELAWLEGDWVRQTKRGEVLESWKRVSPNSMEGVATVTAGDTTHITEHLRMEWFGDEVFYIAKPRENPYPTPFKLIEWDTRFVFENPDHDFPKRIIYTPDGDGGLVVRIEGPSEEGVRGVDFVFEREK